MEATGADDLTQPRLFNRLREPSGNPPCSISLGRDAGGGKPLHTHFLVFLLRAFGRGASAVACPSSASMMEQYPSAPRPGQAATKVSSAPLMRWSCRIFSFTSEHLAVDSARDRKSAG